MNRREAIEAIEAVQSGACADMDLPDSLKGELAKDAWHDPKFRLGIEYGFIIGLMQAFDITAADLTPMP